MPLSIEAVGEYLMLGQAHGIYYFVFVISYLYALGLVLRHTPKAIILAAWVASGVLLAVYYLYWPVLVFPQVTMEAMFRSPFIHSFPFLTGWVLSFYYPRIRAYLSKIHWSSIIIMAACNAAALIALVNLDQRWIPRELMIQVHIYSFLALFLAVTIRLENTPRGSRI